MGYPEEMGMDRIQEPPHSFCHAPMTQWASGVGVLVTAVGCTESGDGGGAATDGGDSGTSTAAESEPGTPIEGTEGAADAADTPLFGGGTPVEVVVETEGADVGSVDCAAAPTGAAGAGVGTLALDGGI